MLKLLIVALLIQLTSATAFSKIKGINEDCSALNKAITTIETYENGSKWFGLNQFNDFTLEAYMNRAAFYGELQGVLKGVLMADETVRHFQFASRGDNPKAVFQDVIELCKAYPDEKFHIAVIDIAKLAYCNHGGGNKDTPKACEELQQKKDNSNE